MLKQLSRIIIKILFFISIPILICILIIEAIVIWYQNEIFLYSDLLNSIPHLTLWLIWVSIISLWFFIIIFRVMKVRLFIFSCIIWSVVLVIAYSIYSQPIKGFVDIPDSVFAFSWIDIHNIPKISPEICSEMKTLRLELNNKSQLLFLNSGSERDLWREIHEKYWTIPEYIEYISLLNEKIRVENEYSNDFYKAISFEEWAITSANKCSNFIFAGFVSALSFYKKCKTAIIRFRKF